jgi:hypothetical protein
VDHEALLLAARQLAALLHSAEWKSHMLPKIGEAALQARTLATMLTAPDVETLARDQQRVQALHELRTGLEKELADKVQFLASRGALPEELRRFYTPLAEPNTAAALFADDPFIDPFGGGGVGDVTQKA